MKLGLTKPVKKTSLFSMTVGMMKPAQKKMLGKVMSKAAKKVRK